MNQETHTTLKKLEYALARPNLSKIDRQWIQQMNNILLTGEWVPNRGGVETITAMGMNPMIYDSRPEDFPIIGAKKIHWESVRTELAWFLDGRTDIAALNKRGVKIWDEWADKDGNVAGVYGRQWRYWQVPNETGEYETVDQITELIDGIKNDPFGRRHILSAWNPGEIIQGKVALPACHTLAQWHVAKNNQLRCSLYQRSADMFLGVPFNVASYSLLNNLIAQATGLKPSVIVHTFGNQHIYSNHLQALQQMADNIMNAAEIEQLTWEPRNKITALNLNYKPWDPAARNNLTEQVDGWELDGYTPLPAVKAPVTK